MFGTVISIMSFYVIAVWAQSNGKPTIYLIIAYVKYISVLIQNKQVVQAAIATRDMPCEMTQHKFNDSIIT